MAVGAKMATTKNIEFGGSVEGIAICIYICRYEILADFNLAVMKIDF